MVAKIVRRASACDAEAIASVHVTSWQETYRDLMPSSILDGLSVEDRANRWRKALNDAPASGDLAVFVASTPENKIVGFGACGQQRSNELDSGQFDGEFQAIYILAAFQRLGLGKMLMIEMAQCLLRSGCNGGSLWVLRDNRHARRFYEGLDGRVVAERKEKRSQDVIFQEVAYGWSDLSTIADL